MTAARSRLHSRRSHEVFEVKHEDVTYTVGLGRYGDGRLGEIFLDCAKGDSSLAARAVDDAVLLSLLLQHGCSIETIRQAPLARWMNGAARGLVGAVLDRLAADEARDKAARAAGRLDAPADGFGLARADFKADVAAADYRAAPPAAELVSTKTPSEQGGSSA
jgi:hypothetical protein